jgi:Mrp family chromosome partitioning ATPase
MESTGDVGIRIDRLREMINDDRSHRENETQLAYLKSELDRVKKLYDAGAVSQARYDEALTLYQKQDAATNDTTQIQAWKAQLTRLQKSITPAKDTTTPSGALLETMVQKTFDIQLQNVAVVQKANYLLGQRNAVKAQLDQIPYLQRQYVVLTRDCDTLEEQRKDLESKLAVATDMEAHQGASFTLVSAADVPDAPLKSKKKVMTLGLSVGIVLAGVAALFGAAFLDKRIKSPADVRIRFDIPLLCAIPNYAKNESPFPGDARSPIAQQLSAIARRLRHSISGSCARIVVVGVTEGDGATTIAANLAATFGRQDEIVLLIDAQQYPHNNCRQIEDLMEGERNEHGLADYLTDPVDDLTSLATRTSMPGVKCLPHYGREIVPDMFGSRRMTDLLEEAGKTYSTVLIDAPPLLSHVESELLVQRADAVIVVVRGSKTRIDDIEKTLAKLTEIGKPVAGIILNGVERAFLKRE